MPSYTANKVGGVLYTIKYGKHHWWVLYAIKYDK